MTSLPDYRCYHVTLHHSIPPLLPFIASAAAIAAAAADMPLIQMLMPFSPIIFHIAAILPRLVTIRHHGLFSPDFISLRYDYYYGHYWHYVSRQDTSLHAAAADDIERHYYDIHIDATPYCYYAIVYCHDAALILRHYYVIRRFICLMPLIFSAIITMSPPLSRRHRLLPAIILRLLLMSVTLTCCRQFHFSLY